MTTTPQLRVLFFDVFGTCVAQRTPVADELWGAAQKALESDVSSISSEVRTKATNMVCSSQLSTPTRYILIFISHTSSGSSLEGLVANEIALSQIQVLTGAGMEQRGGQIRSQ